MNQPTTPNTVEDFLPLPRTGNMMEICVPGDRTTHIVTGYTADQVRAAILADRAQRPVAAPSEIEAAVELPTRPDAAFKELMGDWFSGVQMESYATEAVLKDRASMKGNK